MIVMKFGGSSVRDAERIRHVITLVHATLHERPILVCSAMGSTTNELIEAGNAALKGTVNVDALRARHLDAGQGLGKTVDEVEALFSELRDLLKGISLLQELSKKTMDHLLSFGERLAVRIIAGHFRKAGIAAQHFDAWELGMLSDSRFNDAEVQEESYPAIAGSLAEVATAYPYLPVITGFIAKDRNGAITTLGRGGSDLTASVVGAAIGAAEIQVWKDVDGILTTDPRIVQAAIPVAGITFEEASELAYFGAKVLHPLSMQPAMAKNIPVRVKNSYNPQHPGTLITAKGGPMDGLIKAITCKRNITLIDIVSSRMLGQYGFLARVFQIFNDRKVSVDMVATSEVSISLTLDKGAEIDALLGDLEQIAKVRVSRGKAILSLVGDVARSSEILDAAFSILRKLNINVQMISQGASKVNIGLIVEDTEVERCIRELHAFFFESTKEAA